MEKKGTGQIIHENQIGGSQHGAGRNQTAVVGSDQSPCHMGDHQSDPADEAAQTNGGSAEERRSSNEDQTVKTDIDPKAFGFLFIQSEEIDAPAQKKDDDQSRRHGDQAP